VYSPPSEEAIRSERRWSEDGDAAISVSELCMPARILIADDRAIMRNTLRNLFAICSDWDVCGEVEDVRQAIDAAVVLRPDLVLLDYKMPNGDGVEVASELAQKLPGVPVVIFTLHKTNQLEGQARRVRVKAVGFSALGDELGPELVASGKFDVVLSKHDGLEKLADVVKSLFPKLPIEPE